MMCGVIGCFSANNEAASILRQGLPLLQHRGQDAFGIFLATETGHYRYGQQGLVNTALELLPDQSSRFAIGHCRYATVSDTNTEHCAQPLYISEPCDMALAHNGQFHCLVVPDTTAYDSWYFLSHFQAMVRRHFESCGYDLPAFLSTFARFLAEWEGSFSVLLYVAPLGLLAFRDPRGIRPLVYAHRLIDGQPHIVFASESMVLSRLGYDEIQVVERGSVHCVDWSGMHHEYQYHAPAVFSPCLFEYLYFSSPDSFFDGVSIEYVRRALGRALAAYVRDMVPDFTADMVISIPSSADLFAYGCAEELGLPFCPALRATTKKRSFLLFDPEERRDTVISKFTLDAELVAGRSLAVVDDAVVRGLTSTYVVSLLRSAGAREVIFLSASPPVRHINRYGIFIPTEEELMAYGRSDEELCAAMGADALYYLPMSRIQAVLSSLYPCYVAPEISSFQKS